MSALEEILQAIVVGGDPATLLPPGSRGEVLLQAVLNKVRTTDQTVGGHTTQLEQIALRLNDNSGYNIKNGLKAFRTAAADVARNPLSVSVLGTQ